MLIDTHLHLIDRNRLEYPWLSDVPPLNQDWTYQAYHQVARRVGISATLHMEVDVAPAQIPAETTMVAELMTAQDSLIRGAIASGRPEKPGFQDYLEGLDRSVVKGLRRVLHVMPDDLSQSALFRDNIRALEAANLPFDICVLASQLGLAADLADAAPGVSFVLDHCGVPDIADGGFDAWATEISEISKRSNVNVKISGLVAYTGGTWGLDTIRPYVEHVIGSFGWKRVVWGSDSPVCTLGGNLETWVATTYALLEGCSADEREAFMSKNAKRIWQIDV
ncbi:amidohydrolase family protein [Roseibium algae]|uniref:Amidohydrolase n=1 Tax=Roseibium algae TaxID=3123038 RepID=A0ABU8TQ72_9HYPH